MSFCTVAAVLSGFVFVFFVFVFSPILNTLSSLDTPRVTINTFHLKYATIRVSELFFKQGKNHFLITFEFTNDKQVFILFFWELHKDKLRNS